MPTAKLEELFTETQIQEIERLINIHHDSLDLVKSLKQYFAMFANELEAKGLLPDYAAYTIVAGREQLRAELARRN